MRRENLSRRIGTAAVAMALSLALCSNALAVSADETPADTGTVVETMAETGEVEATPEADLSDDAPVDPADSEGSDEVAEPGEPEGDSSEQDTPQDDSDAPADDADGTSDDEDAETVGETGDPTKADEAAVQTAPVMQNHTRRAMARAPRAAEAFTIAYADGTTADWDGLTDLTIDKSCTITLNKDLDQTTSTAKLTIAADEEIAVTIEGNNHTLTTNTGYGEATTRFNIGNNATVTIQNLTIKESGNLNGTSMALIKAHGSAKVTLQNCPINATLTPYSGMAQAITNGSAPILLSDTAEMNIVGSKIDVDKGRAIWVAKTAKVTIGEGSAVTADFWDTITNYGTVNVAGGTVTCTGGYTASGFSSDYRAIVNSGTVVISAGQVSSDSAYVNSAFSPRSIAICNQSGNIKISGGTVSGYQYGIQFMGTSTAHTLDMTGGAILTESTASDNVASIWAGNNVEDVTINISGGTVKSYGHAIEAGYSNKTINISGGEILGTSAASSVALVSIMNSATCNMTGGKIVAGKQQKAVYLYDATFNMDDGEISADTTDAVIARNQAVFNMNGGEISGNGNEPVWVYFEGTFNMNGGTVTGNGKQAIVASYAGFLNVTGGTIIGKGKYVVMVDDSSAYTGSKSAMTMTGGTIRGTGSNWGIYAKAQSTTLTGGTIRDTSYGVLCYKDGITIGDQLQFANNSTADLWLSTDIRFTINDDYAGTAVVYPYNAADGRRLTTDDTDDSMLERITLASQYSGSYIVAYDNSDAYLYMLPHTHSWHYDVKDNTITVSCDSTDTGAAYCPYTLTNQETKGALTWTLTAEDADYNADGSPYTGASVIEPERKLNETPWGTGVLTYVSQDSTTYSESETAPSAPGDYTAKYTFTTKDANGEKHSYSATKNFTIRAQASEISITKTGEEISKTYDGKSVALTAHDCEVTGENRDITFIWQAQDGDGWKDLTSAPTNAGTYRVKAKAAASSQYRESESSYVTFTIAKATPGYTMPTGLTATEGQTLADITLPEGFSWTNDAMSVGTVGAHTYTATFTPTDTTNYETVEGIELTIMVEKKGNDNTPDNGTDNGGSDNSGSDDSGSHHSNSYNKGSNGTTATPITPVQDPTNGIVTNPTVPDGIVDDTAANDTADAADGTDNATNANDSTTDGFSANQDGNGGYIGSGAGNGHIAATGDDSLIVLYAAMAGLSAITLATWTRKARCHR